MSVDLNAPVQQAQANRGFITGMFGDQRGESSDFLSRLSGTIQGQPSTSAMAERIGGELGLPTMRANAQSLQNTLFNIPHTYGAATRGFDVNQNQLSRIIGQKSSEIAPAASLASSNVLEAESELGRRLGYEQEDRNRALIPLQAEKELMSDRFARETTGYTTAMQSELDAIIAKMNAGVTISEGEKNRANALAVAEIGYKQALETARINANAPFAVGKGSMGIWQDNKLNTGNWR